MIFYSTGPNMLSILVTSYNRLDKDFDQLDFQLDSITKISIIQRFNELKFVLGKRVTENKIKCRPNPMTN